jgi:hypothetical protein
MFLVADSQVMSEEQHFSDQFLVDRFKPLIAGFTVG